MVLAKEEEYLHCCYGFRTSDNKVSGLDALFVLYCSEISEEQINIAACSSALPDASGRDAVLQEAGGGLKASIRSWGYRPHAQFRPLMSAIDFQALWEREKALAKERRKKRSQKRGKNGRTKHGGGEGQLKGRDGDPTKNSLSGVKKQANEEGKKSVLNERTTESQSPKNSSHSNTKELLDHLRKTFASSISSSSFPTTRALCEGGKGWEKHCVSEFGVWSDGKTNTGALELLLQPRSLLVFSQSAYKRLFHGIAERDTDLISTGTISAEKAVDAAAAGGGGGGATDLNDKSDEISIKSAVPNQDAAYRRRSVVMKRGKRLSLTIREVVR
eukprot:jgi/Bigna1/143392/aug1.78_g18100